ncbi:hypothetical protein PC118_g17641 [Phytophthora cactorum]|uniref:non-specific serine/threonine protein kinase n=1 Tax=Phytophthora cactorum TaxID=29920 RepID=A0A8T1BUE1_9STRA|nr:hypothetical protein PC114_g20588 [Phytophthora cactorum]KAG2896723.1 hypothetical protein PC115_g17431 [Phytophthora cactorum]KAG2910736.1 hypothetical protein PC117_g19330 [Phytophthora cactorum]KAG2969077.1 hypothetical protein PC118_g17641 [Phytophthora cactorum]KAG3003011.1 hypothetical protein PC120_g19373 [Phytophthora cactorum]
MASIQQNENPEGVYEVLERIGEGSYGKVYKAVNKSNAEVVALKVVPVESEDRATFDELTREIRILERCESPFVVQYRGSFSYESQLWIAMEFCAAGSLADLHVLRGRHVLKLAEGEPPLAHMHPMRAIFLIPNRAPPELREPNKYSAEFRNFLAVCLKKDPQERASAEELLRHPFIARNVERLRSNSERAASGGRMAGLPVLQELVEQSLELVHEARQRGAEDEAEFRDAATGRPDGSLSVADLSTMLRNGSMFSNGTGNFGGFGGSDTAVGFSSMRLNGFGGGTTVFSSSASMDEEGCGTMVYRGDDNKSTNSTMESTSSETREREITSSDLYGTMIPVSASGTVRPPPAPVVPVFNSRSSSRSSSHGSSQGETTKPEAESNEPSFMKYFRRITSSSSKSGTIRAAGATEASLRTVQQKLRQLEEDYDRNREELARRFEKQKAELERELS